jgi:diguanylate cyclase (GGDEF)-like protein
VNKASFGIGAVMLAAAAVFIYFDDPLYVRIIAGVIFVAGAFLLYQTLAGTVGAADAEVELPDDTQAEITQNSEVATHAASHYAEVPPLSGVDSPPAIPQELYRFDLEALPQDDPRAEFDYLTNRLLRVLKEHILAHTVGLFWINMDREQIIIGEFVTDSRNFTTARRLSLGADLLSRIARVEKPEIVSEISQASESDVAMYYDSPEGIRSIVGVPVFFNSEIVAVIAADSRAEDAFGLETVASIGRVGALITLLLGSYTQKHDLAADSRMLGVLDRMRRGFEEIEDAYGIANVAAKALTEIMDWDYVAVILQNPETQQWAVVRSLSRAANLPYVAEGVKVQLEHSVLRPALDSPEGIIIDAPAAPVYRFHEKEVINSFGQICALPLVSKHSWYGLLVVEYRETHQYAKQDLNIMRRIAMQTTMALEVARLHELTRKNLLIDEVTHTSSRTLLLRRLTEEQERIKAFGGTAVFFLVSLDQPDELLQRHGRHEIDAMLKRIAEGLREHLRGFDVFGRFNGSSFGLLLLHSSPEDAYLRGEKIRKHIAGSVQSHGGVTYSASVSIAGCTMSQSTDIDSLLRLARQAMDRAVSDGGNCVKVV